MKTWVRKTLSVGVLAAGALLFAPAAAQADSVGVNAGDNGSNPATQFVTVANVPVSPASESAQILGAGDARGALLEHGDDQRRDRRGGQGPDVFQVHGDSAGWLTGNQVYLPVTIPLNVVGNSILTAGRTDSRGVGVNRIEESGTERRGDGRRGDSPSVVQVGDDSYGWLTGNQVYAPIDIPINACGNSILAIGPVVSRAVCANGISRDESASTGGNALFAPTAMPELLSGSSRTVSAGRVRESGPADTVQAHGDSRGIGSGNQIVLPITAPINACGNSVGALSLLGGVQSSAVCANVIRDARGNGDDRDRDCDRDRDRDGRCFGNDDDRDHNCDRDRGCFGDRDWHRGCDGRNGLLSDALFFSHDRCGRHDGHIGGIKGDHGSRGHGNKGDHGGKGNKDDDKYAAANGVSPDTNDNGYGQGEEPDNYAKPAATGSNSKATGGRQAADLTESVNGLGLLNTLR
ncbi:chaplin [Actinoplanes sp. TBRC 11911]|uniref:chaplin n=1 Tax=Actinoplanes sp. TBRC 11911 TaxID=2729386 RepID=UPI00145F54E7|nr:chaplin [Actinoplanes sp. TBRC 11911]NMO56790.1 chaplin [Actinoplanes sp. TBRC 11911]